MTMTEILAMLIRSGMTRDAAQEWAKRMEERREVLGAMVSRNFYPDLSRGERRE